MGSMHKVRTPSGLVGLVDPMGNPVSSGRSQTVTLADVTHPVPTGRATTAHYGLRSFYRKMLDSRVHREDSVLTEICQSDDREWLENLLQGLADGQPGPSLRTRRRWRAAIEHRLSLLPASQEGRAITDFEGSESGMATDVGV